MKTRNQIVKIKIGSLSFKPNNIGKICRSIRSFKPKKMERKTKVKIIARCMHLLGISGTILVFKYENIFGLIMIMVAILLYCFLDYYSYEY